MNDVATWTSTDRRDLFTETASRRGISQISIVEKDFWVCWTLGRLFGQGTPVRMIFKGGTSLSKAFKLIQRFSEDIDLSLDRHDLGFRDDRDPANAPSNSAAARLIDELLEVCSRFVGTTLKDSLQAAFASVLAASGDLRWGLEIDREDPQTLNFHYPASLPESEYAKANSVRPIVKLEFGARSDQWPAGTYQISSYVAEEFPGQFKTPSCAVLTLEARRTFWEKATLLHMEYHRSPFNTRDSLSRHYYDLALLGRNAVRGDALRDLDLLSQVARHKDRFFHAAWARYDLARPSSLRLLPNGDLEALLRRDYEKTTKELIFGEPPSFDQIMSDLTKLEKEINSLA